MTERATNRIEIPPEWREPVDRWAWRQLARILLTLTVPLIASPWLVVYGLPWLLLATVPIMGIGIYKLIFVLHETSHHTLFSKKRFNRSIGTLCARLLASDFDMYKEEHWHHHKTYGEPDDPQGPEYVGLRWASRWRIFQHLFRPLLGYNLRRESGQTLLNPAGDVRGRRMVGLLIIGLTQVVIALVATGFGRVWWLFPIYPATAVTLAMFLTQFRGFCEHVARAKAETEQHVRTHLPNWFDEFVFYDLNFNYHLEHHLHPELPGCHLPEIFEVIRETHHDDSTLSYSIMGTAVDRLKEAA